MRKASMIIALIFGLLGIFGGACNLVGGACGAAKLGVEQGMKMKNENQIKPETHELAVMGTKGIFAAFFCGLGLIFGVIVGNSKSSKTALIFAILLIISGIIATFLTNYFSGPMLTIAGIVGLFGSRSE